MRALEREAGAADIRDDRVIQGMQNKIWLTAGCEGRGKAGADLKHQQEQDRQRREREAEQRPHEEHRRWQERAERQGQYDNYGFSNADTNTTCRHGSWWQKVEGYVSCPGCGGGWTYLLQCPGCEIKACPRCQAATQGIKPRPSVHRGRSTTKPTYYEL